MKKSGGTDLHVKEEGEKKKEPQVLEQSNIMANQTISTSASCSVQAKNEEDEGDDEGDDDEGDDDAGGDGGEIVVEKPQNKRLDWYFLVKGAHEKHQEEKKAYEQVATSKDPTCPCFLDPPSTWKRCERCSNLRFAIEHEYTTKQTVSSLLSSLPSTNTPENLLFRQKIWFDVVDFALRELNTISPK